MHRVLALLALVGLLTAPVLSRTQHICRYSGEELSSCIAEAPSSSPKLVSEGCCERRQLTALAQMRPAQLHREPIAAPRWIAAPVALALESAAPPASPAWAVLPRASGPPLFVRHRALLY